MHLSSQLQGNLRVCTSRIPNSVAIEKKERLSLMYAQEFFLTPGLLGADPDLDD
jgi:hypothetical protein